MNFLPFLPLHLCTMFIGLWLTGPVHAQKVQPPSVVKGTFLGDGKDAHLQFLVVQTREAFSDKPAIRLVFTEKDPALSKKPDFDAGFKKLGSALVLSVFQDGQIFGCEVAHTAHPKSPFSAIGEIKMKEFLVTGTVVSGRVSTEGTRDAFGQKWDVDLTFSASLPKGAFAGMGQPSAKPQEEDKEDHKPSVTGPKLPVAKLPLPAAALEVEFKTAVEHIAFRCDASVSAVAGDFSKKLKQQGWKDTPGSLMGKTNAILKREWNGAELTVMVQPAGAGCTVKVFTKGLDWSEAPASIEPAAKPSGNDAVKEIEAEADRLLKEPLKQIPDGIKIPGGLK